MGLFLSRLTLASLLQNLRRASRARTETCQMKSVRGLAILACLVLIWAWLTLANRAQVRPLTIRFWNGFTGPDGRKMLKIVRQFNQQNPGIQVFMQRMDWGTYYNKLFVANLGHRAPEVFVVHASSLPRFARAGFLQPLDQFIDDKAHPIARSDFDPNVMREMQYGSQTMAVPLDIHPMGMYFNARLLRENGFVNPDGSADPPATKEQFLAVLKKLKQKRPDGTQQWGFVFTNFRNNVLALMDQFGGKLVSDDGQKCLLDGPENVAALEFASGLIKQGLAPPPELSDAWIGFRQGKVALAWEGIYYLSDLEKQPELQFGGAPIPVIGKQPATWADSHGLCLRSDLSGKKRDAAWRFIKFLSDHSVEWAAAGQIPVRMSLRNTSAFKAMPVQNAFAKEIPYVHYSPRVPFIFEFFSEFDLAVERAMRGTMPAKEALQIATVRIDKAIERDRRENALAKKQKQ